MIKAARWSRKKNEELKAKNEDSQEQAVKNAFQGYNLKEAIAKFYTSSIPKPEAYIAKALAIGAIIVFGSFILLMAYYAWTRI
ncbi:MAG: hypothetical protein OEZ10_08010 [Gammaproteobacteria bacterium]|nr:hypothetical protein [Gammaproteobacteria bacterium]